ncbi:RNA polymerase sigma factor RpoD/SigA [Gemmata sp. JC673]|uniref:RNA polymerase sigma factor RpoD/SigA n=1 Tax=Gemmata algarum TaxID=2975278 RepID=A0ABU5EVI0_9BACT|nr:RNA polymerase sigma factor RpoD/SigA [Gemmata algarum]MDY3557726.1 RNA polymerase sigma factor RpoD/SigA [Gemmata algarum]
MGTSAPGGTAMSAYLREIDRTPLLSATEERELGGRILDGDPAARDRMVRANLRLVVNLARGYTGRGLSLDDLVAEGNMGLLRAVEGFDPGMSTRFSTYASFWIKQSIQRAIVNTARTIRVPTYMAALVARWRRATAALGDELGRAPAPEEVAGHLGLSRRKLVMVQLALKVAGAGTQADDADGGLEGLIPDTRDSGSDADAAEQLRLVFEQLGRLNPRDADVLRLRFGLSGEEPKTLKEVGEALGLTKERVRQIESAALSALAAGLGDNN